MHAARHLRKKANAWGLPSITGAYPIGCWAPPNDRTTTVRETTRRGPVSFQPSTRGAGCFGSRAWVVKMTVNSALPSSPGFRQTSTNGMEVPALR